MLVFGLGRVRFAPALFYHRKCSGKEWKGNVTSDIKPDIYSPTNSGNSQEDKCLRYVVYSEACIHQRQFLLLTT